MPFKKCYLTKKKHKERNRKTSPGTLKPIMELSWKSHGILFNTFLGNPECAIITGY